MADARCCSGRHGHNYAINPALIPIAAPDDRAGSDTSPEASRSDQHARAEQETYNPYAR